MSIIPFPTRRDLRIVVLECPYDSWDDPFTQQMFSRMAQLKLQGYASRYPYGVLPVDGTDLVSTHLMICDLKGGELNPLLAYRSITDWRVRTHALKFPGLAIAEGAGSTGHIRAFTQILEQARSREQLVRYCSSYTIRPDARDDRDFAQQLKTYMTGMHTLFHTDYRTDISLLTGVIRVHTDKFFASWGYEPMSLDGQDLPPVKQASLFGEEALMMKLTEFSDHARECALKTRHLWDQRLTVREKPQAQKAA